MGKKKGLRRRMKRVKRVKQGTDSGTATADRKMSIVTLPRNYLLPDKMRVNFRYTEQLSYAAATSFIQVYRGNSIFDPNFTGTGGQPYGHDQFNALYANYFVEASMIEFKLLSTSNTAVSICLAPTKGTAPTFAELSQHPFARIKTMYGGTSNGTWGTLKGSARTLVMEDRMDIRDLYALFGANPANQWFWCHRVSSIDGVTNFTGQAQVCVTYSTVLWERVDLGVSEPEEPATVPVVVKPCILREELKTPRSAFELVEGAERGESKAVLNDLSSGRDTLPTPVGAVPRIRIGVDSALGDQRGPVKGVAMPPGKPGVKAASLK